MANYASKVIDIALGQVGYLEKKSNSNLDSKTANAGYNNYTKYARDFDKKYQSLLFCNDVSILSHSFAISI